MALPAHADLAKVLAGRIAARGAGGGVAGMEALLGPLDAGEARSPPASRRARGSRPRWRAGPCARSRPPWEEIADRGIVTPAEAVARLLPTLTAAARGRAIVEEDLGRLFVAEYRAFRSRRSLLPLDLQTRVRFEELPWIAALSGVIDVRGAPARAARDAMAHSASLVLTRFPDALLPNPLIRDLDALAGAAGLRIPLTYELAADIFTGRFSGTVREATLMASEMMRGTLYARYYDLPDAVPIDLAQLCASRAEAEGDWRGSEVARRGRIIEQSQILTTHNLAQLTDALGLRDELALRALDLAETCHVRVLRRQSRPPDEPHAALRNLKDAAYAWRQMLFLLSPAPPGALPGFLVRADALMDGLDAFPRERFAPAMQGLRDVVAGWPFGIDGRSAGGGWRFLGWGTGRHWLPAERWYG